MKTSIVGFPRIGALRELKFAAEKYWKGEIETAALEDVAKTIRSENLKVQKDNALDFLPSNDFSFYDGMLDTAVMLGAVPERYKKLGLPVLDTYFAMARGYQGKAGDVKALAMKKWFNTNYHYMVSEIEDTAELKLSSTKPFDLFSEAKASGSESRPVVIGAYTFLKLAKYVGTKNANDFADAVAAAYVELLEKFAALGADWFQIDEPCLVMDMSAEDKNLFVKLYKKILASKKNVKVLLQTYFGDVRDSYDEICSLAFDGLGLDFIEGQKTLELVSNKFPKDKTLFAGVVNGKNIWKNNYEKTLDIIEKIKGCGAEIVLNTSCSLLHVPVTLENETKMAESYKKHFAYAREKLQELSELKKITESANPRDTAEYKANVALHAEDRGGKNSEVQKKVAALTEKDFVRLPEFAEREKIQHKRFSLPKFPTTTIGSFPQTQEVRQKRAAFKKGTLSEVDYENFLKEKISDCVKWQEEIGLDVLVHGEFERNDMVEYFGECLDGFIFTEKAWVQSYGTRCVKPPIVWGDVSRAKPMTVKWSAFAQSVTKLPMKGMLTGPVTILNWSFPREDITLKESTEQIALAIREEVLDLEANGISIIQVDEAALREKLPLRKSDWKSAYLSWAIPAFRLVHSGVKPETQIHTHMCYSEFGDIIRDIDDMDADVITFEASRASLSILDDLKAAAFRTEVGPGVYDIHSPRVPSKEEITGALEKMLTKIESDKLWVNPDCGLKTRGESETKASLVNLVAAAKELRAKQK